MTRWTWALATVVGIVLGAIVVMFGLTADPAMQSRLLGYLDAIVPFVVGAGAGAAAGGSFLFLKGVQQKLSLDMLVTDWTWPLVLVVGLVVAAIVAMFGLTDDAAIRDRLLGYFDAVLPFIVGAGAGATVGGTVGFFRGRG